MRNGFCRKLLVAVFLGASLTCAHGQELVFDWGIKYYPSPVVGVVPLLRLVSAPDYSNPLQLNFDNGNNVGILLRNPSSPLDGDDPTSNVWENRNSLAQVLAWLDAHDLRLDYVFADFEFHLSTAVDPLIRRQENLQANNANLEAVIDMVRSHPNQNIAKARIGNFDYFAGAQMLSEPFPQTADRAIVDAFYRTAQVNGNRVMNVSMPDMYPVDYHKTHAIGVRWNAWGEYSAPNIHSALFWAPLENLSTAKRNLPAGDQLIPWISTFVSYGQTDYPVDLADRPTPSDYKALLQHARLRGADGYYTWEDAGAPIDLVQTYANWHQLDWFFNLPGDAIVLNVNTNKTTGLEWSGFRRRDRVLVLASNLSGASAVVPLQPASAGLPATTPVLANNSHLQLQYLVTKPMDQNFEGYPPYVAVGNYSFGSNAQDWEFRPGPIGSANESMALTRRNAAAWKTTWFEMATPAFLSTDRVVYSAKMFSGQGSNASVVAGSGFGPCSISAGLRNNPAGFPNDDHQGVSLVFVANRNVLRVERNLTGGQLKFQSVDTNLIAANTWYEVQLVVTNPAAGGTGRIFIRDMSVGGEFIPVELDDLSQAGTQSTLEIPLYFDDLYLKPSTFNGWEVWGQNSTVHFDDFHATIYPYVEQFSGPAL